MIPPEKVRCAWIPLAAALLAIVVFSNALRNDFVWDDKELIVDNAAVHQLDDISPFFARHFWSESGQPTARGYYRPLILLSYAIDYMLWGPNPIGFHLSNMLWHALASALVCMLVMRTISSPAAALVAGALFAVHPVHVESVTFISGRTDVIATVFALASVHLFLLAREGRAVTLTVPLSVVSFMCALLSKEVAAILPVLLLVADVTVAAPEGKRVRLPAHALYWLTLFLYLAVRFGALRIAPQLQGRLNLQEVLFTMPAVAVDYLRLLLFPVNLCADYVVTVQHSATFTNILVIVFLLLACGGVGFLIVKRKVSGLFAAWIFAGLLPVLQVIPISALKAERFLYLPSAGFCMLIGCLLAFMLDTIAKAGKRWLAVAAGFMILCFAFQTFTRNTVWRDEFTLYRVTESCAPNNFRVQYNLGNAYFRAGDTEQALRHTEIAFRLRPDFPRVNYNLGVIYAAAGRRGEAETMYRRAVELDPSYAWAHSALAAVLYADGRFQEARLEWTKALSLDPTLEQAREGLRLLDHGRPPEELSR
jgi:hypothetical protein